MRIYTHIHIHKHIYTHITTYTTKAKMAFHVNDGIENNLNVIVFSTGGSGNIKKELKATIFETVSNLRKLFAKLINTKENNARKIIELVK